MPPAVHLGFVIFERDDLLCTFNLCIRPTGLVWPSQSRIPDLLQFKNTFPLPLSFSGTIMRICKSTGQLILVWMAVCFVSPPRTLFLPLSPCYKDMSRPYISAPPVFLVFQKVGPLSVFHCKNFLDKYSHQSSIREVPSESVLRLGRAPDVISLWSLPRCDIVAVLKGIPYAALRSYPPN